LNNYNAILNRKIALVSSAVTGKIDVKKEAA